MKTTSFSWWFSLGNTKFGFHLSHCVLKNIKTIDMRIKHSIFKKFNSIFDFIHSLFKMVKALIHSIKSVFNSDGKVFDELFGCLHIVNHIAPDNTVNADKKNAYFVAFFNSLRAVRLSYSTCQCSTLGIKH